MSNEEKQKKSVDAESSDEQRAKRASVVKVIEFARPADLSKPALDVIMSRVTAGAYSTVRIEGPIASSVEAVATLAQGGHGALLESVTLISGRMFEPIIVDPNNLDFVQFQRYLGARIADDENADVFIEILLAVAAKHEVVQAFIKQVIPDRGSLARFARGNEFLSLGDLLAVGNNIVNAIKADKKWAAKLTALSPNWISYARDLTGILLQALFAPLKIVLGIEPIVLPPPRLVSRIPTLRTLEMVAAFHVMKQGLLTANPGLAFEHLTTLERIPFANATREYFRQLSKEMRTVLYRSRALLYTGLDIVNQKATYLAHVDPAAQTAMTIPSMEFTSPALDSLVSNWTVLTVAAAAASKNATQGKLGDAETAAAVDHVTDIISDIDYFDRLPLRALRTFLSVNETMNMQGQRSGLIIEPRYGGRLTARVAQVDTPVTGQYDKLEQAPVTQLVIDAVVSAYPDLKNLDGTMAMMRLLERIPDAETRQTASVVYASVPNELMPAGDIATTLSLVAAAFADEVYAVPTQNSWSLTYVMSAQPTKPVSLLIDAPLGTVVTLSPELVLYMKAPTQQATDDFWPTQDDPSVYMNKFLRTSALRQSGLLHASTPLTGAMPVVNNIARTNYHIDLGLERDFFGVLIFGDMEFFTDPAYTRALRTKVEQLRAALQSINRLRADGALDKDAADLEARMALMPYFSWLHTAAAAQPLFTRIRNAFNSAIAVGETKLLRAQMSAAFIKSEACAQVGVTAAAYALVALHVLEEADARFLIEAFRDAGIFSRVSFGARYVQSMIPVL